MNAQMNPAPLHFTHDYYTPEALDAAFGRWKDHHQVLGAYWKSHMWHQIGGNSHSPPGAVTSQHECHILSADLRPGFIGGGQGPHGEIRTYREGPGDLIYQANCPPCSWHHIATSENAVVEAWHDHATPGWRHLPIIPLEVRAHLELGKWKKKGIAWIEANYPAEWQAPGHPVITEREHDYAVRHVPGYSPWGGYDLSHTALDATPATSGAEQMVLF